MYATILRHVSRAFLFVIAAVFPLLAQQGTVQGVVMDASGAAVPEAKITVRNVNTGVTQTVETNKEGFYSIPFLVPGPYEVAANATGFSTQTRRGLQLDVNMTARVDFTVAIGTVAEAVEVSASAAILNTETSVVGQVIDNRRIVELPLNGRNYLELAQLTTGVVPGRGSRSGDKGNFSALGARTYQTNILLDGVDNNSRASGGQLGFEAQNVTPSVDAVQEFKVITNNNSAEYGFRMGATVIVQTKSGSNDFHGSAYEFFRNDKLDATNFFANRAECRKASLQAESVRSHRRGTHPRDRTFFFGSFEGTRFSAENRARPLFPRLPGEPEILPIPKHFPFSIPPAHATKEHARYAIASLGISFPPTASIPWRRLPSICTRFPTCPARPTTSSIPEQRCRIRIRWTAASTTASTTTTASSSAIAGATSRTLIPVRYRCRPMVGCGPQPIC